VLFAAFAIVAALGAADISGTWEVEATFDDSKLAGGGFDCLFKQVADKLTGNCSDGTASVAGDVAGQSITWRLSAAAGTSVTTTFTGTLNDAGTRIEGRFQRGDQGGRFIAAKS
jgi:hypothetical protein